MKAIWDMALELLKACDLMDRSNIEDPTRRAIFSRDGDLKCRLLLKWLLRERNFSFGGVNSKRNVDDLALISFG